MSKPTWLERITDSSKPAVEIKKMTARLEKLLPELEEMKRIQAEIDDIKSALEYDANETYEASSEVVYNSSSVEVEFSVRSIVRKFKDKTALVKYLGKDQFIEHANLSMSEFDKLVPKDLRKKFVSARRIGSRACKIKMA